jgi:hypothetical protein
MTRARWDEAFDEAEQAQARANEEGVDLSAVPLTVDQWLTRDLPPRDYIMGNWLTTTSRAIANAPTGLGKTHFAMALFAHMGAGKDFLHWRTPRPSRVLFVDGEMSRRLLRQRVEDVVRRMDVTPSGLFILSAEDIPHFQPLNTPEGMAVIMQVIHTIGRLDCVCFDNVMSLVDGSMKDEESWQEVLPFIGALTENHIGQLWVHHTGHDTTKGYGSKTREWGMDTVIHLTEAKRPDTDVSFSLAFPKARERTPETRHDFEEVTVALVNDEWVCSAAVEKRSKVSPLGEKFLLALQEVFAGGETVPFEGWKAVDIERWRAECERMGLIEAGRDNGARARFSKYKTELIAANRIACRNTLAWLR